MPHFSAQLAVVTARPPKKNQVLALRCLEFRAEHDRGPADGHHLFPKDHHLFIPLHRDLYVSFSFDPERSIMTGTWRDTLFVWNGMFQLQTNDEGSSSAAADWSGSWIGCQDCPDPRTAATPNAAAFFSSNNKFEVNGTANNVSLLKNESSSSSSKQAVIASLSDGSGWDLAGEDGKMARYRDNFHEIMFFPRQKYYIPVTDDNSHENFKYNVVVAKGKNDFGSFISAGQRRHDNNHNEEFCLILGRRYLEDGDERAKWSLDQLYHTVLEEFSQIEHPSRARRGNKPFSPWRCLCLHAERKRKRKREASSAVAAPPPALYMPTPNDNEFRPQLQIVNIGNNNKNDNNNPITTVAAPQQQCTAPHIQWEYQCWGCGNPAMQHEAMDLKIIIEIGNGVPWDFMDSEFCSASCCLKVLPELARISKIMLENVRKQSESHFLLQVTKVNDKILLALKEDPSAIRSIEEAGWKIHGGIWRLM